MDLNASILVDTIFLLINENTEDTRDLANKLIVLFKEAKIVDTDDTDVIRFYIRILHRIISEQLDKSSMESLRALVLKMKSEAIFASHKEYLIDLEKTILSETIMSKEERRKLKKVIKTVIQVNQYEKQLKQGFGKIQRIKAMDSLEARAEALKEFETTLCQEMIPNTDNDSDYDGPKPQDSIFAKDKTALKDAFLKVHERRTSGVLRTGRKGINRMLGKAGGFASDGSLVVVAPSHHGKSMTLNDLVVWAVAYNKFPERNGKKPLIYLASTENGAQENYLLIYAKLYTELHGEMPPAVRTINGDPAPEDIEERVAMVSKFFSDAGVELLVEFYAAHEFGCVEFVSKLKYLDKAGYYIPVAVFDYLAKSKMPVAPREDIALCVAYNYVCNYAKSKGIFFATGHQYTRDGLMRLDGKLDKVKSMSMSGIKGGADAFQIVDCVIFQILETNHQNVRYVTQQLAKHRYVTDTDPSKLHTAYPIKGGFIKDDFNEPESRAVKDIYTDDGTNVEGGYKPKGKEDSNSLF